MILNDIGNLQNWVKRTINDPLVKILLENSQFTQIQLETLLIDLLAEQNIDEKMNNLMKAKVRLSDKQISRGSFNRTLQQARRNMNKSIWTVLLLGYLGILDTPSLNPFIETSYKLEDYIKEYENIKNKLKNDPNDKESLKILPIMQNNIKVAIFSLISSKKVNFLT